MQLYDITIAVNTTRQLDAPGSYFYYYAGSAGGADSTITLRGVSSGLRLILKPGQSFRLPKGSTETSWIMTNYANAATIIGNVIVGDGDIQDNRITGNVEVIDGGKNRTLANQAFGFSSYAIAQAGLIAHIQVWNPTTSGKNIFIEQISTNTGSSSGISIKQHNASIGTLDTYAAPKRIGGSASTAEIRQAYAAAVIPSANRIWQSTNGQIIKFSEPIMIPPGWGMVCHKFLVNEDIQLTAEWYEENI